jgi:hypothetical protein
MEYDLRNKLLEEQIHQAKTDNGLHVPIPKGIYNEWFIEDEPSRSAELEKRISESNRIIQKEVTVNIESEQKVTHEVKVRVQTSIVANDKINKQKIEICVRFRDNPIIKDYTYRNPKSIYYRNASITRTLYPPSDETVCNAYTTYVDINKTILLSPRYGYFDMHFILNNFNVFIDEVLSRNTSIYLHDVCDIYWYVIYILCIHHWKHPDSCAYTILENLHVQGEKGSRSIANYFNMHGTIRPLYIRMYANIISLLQKYSEDIQIIDIQPTYK